MRQWQRHQNQRPPTGPGPAGSAAISSQRARALGAAAAFGVPSSLDGALRRGDRDAARAAPPEQRITPGGGLARADCPCLRGTAAVST